MQCDKRIRGAKIMHPVLPKPQTSTLPCSDKSLNAIEDKELRKKLRNRQSALAARERKKARMIQLEKTVVKLQESNEKLTDENSKLKQALGAYLCSTHDMCCACYSNNKSKVTSLGHIMDSGSKSSSMPLAASVSSAPGRTDICKLADTCHNGRDCTQFDKTVSPIDYSMKSSRTEVCSNMSSVKQVPRRVIKSEENWRQRGVNTMYAPRRHSGTLNIHPSFSSDTINSEISYSQTGHRNSGEDVMNNCDPKDQLFVTNHEEAYQGLSRSESMVTTECQSPRKDNSCSSVDLNCSMLDLAVLRDSVSQTLPSIDVVLTASTKLHKNNSSNSQSSGVPNRRVSDSVQRKKLTPEKKTLLNDEQSRDPCLYQVNDILSFQFMLNSPFPTSNTFPSTDHAKSGENYRTGPSNDITHQKISTGYSPLDSSSGDSGVGVDDDSLDWIPDASFLNFD